LTEKDSQAFTATARKRLSAHLGHGATKNQEENVSIGLKPRQNKETFIYILCFENYNIKYTDPDQAQK
jgi:hypothetical protein